MNSVIGRNERIQHPQSFKGNAFIDAQDLKMQASFLYLQK